MTKRDYVLIARVINEFSRERGWAEPKTRALARKFASELLETNHRFEVLRFIDACMPQVTSEGKQ